MKINAKILFSNKLIFLVIAIAAGQYFFVKSFTTENIIEEVKKTEAEYNEQQQMVKQHKKIKEIINRVKESYPEKVIDEEVVQVLEYIESKTEETGILRVEPDMSNEQIINYVAYVDINMEVLAEFEKIENFMLDVERTQKSAYVSNVDIQYNNEQEKAKGIITLKVMGMPKSENAKSALNFDIKEDEKKEEDEEEKVNYFGQFVNINQKVNELRDMQSEGSNFGAIEDIGSLTSNSVKTEETSGATNLEFENFGSEQVEGLVTGSGKSIDIVKEGTLISEYKEGSKAHIYQCKDDWQVKTLEAGIVSHIGEMAGIGKFIIVVGTEYQYMYGYLNNINVSRGDYVEERAILADVSAGKAYFAVIKENIFINPNEILEN